MHCIKWREIFETHLRPHHRELRLTKLIKVDLVDLDCILMCTLSRTLNPTVNMVTVRIMKNMKDVVS